MKKFIIFFLVFILFLASYIGYRKYLNMEFNKKFNLEHNKNHELNYLKTHKRLISKLNGNISYSYQDSTKKVKTGVTKAAYIENRYSVFWDTDSIKLVSGRPFVQIIDLIKTKLSYKGIRKINVLYREDLKSNFKKLNIIKMSIGYGVEFLPTKRGTGQIVTQVDGEEGIKENFEFFYIVY